jgi:hypothetical protein
MQVFLAVDGIEVWMASPGASRRSFGFVTSEKDVPEVVGRLQESLLEDNCPLLAVNAEQSVAPAAVV